MINISEIQINKISINDIAKHISLETAKNNALELKDIENNIKISKFTIGKYLRILLKKQIIKKLSYGHIRVYISNYSSILDDEKQQKCNCGAPITYFKNKEIYMCEDCFDVIINQS